MSLDIALYGLSANPIHNAHLTIINGLSDYFDFVFVWAVDNPDKYQMKNYLPLKVRNTMVQMVIDDINLDNVFNTPHFSFPETGKSIELIRKYYPNDRLWIVFGSDCIISIPTWDNIGLLKMATGFIEIPRPNTSIYSMYHMIDNKKMPIVSIDLNTSYYSSTEIRNKLIHIDTEFKELLKMLPKYILNFIINENLFISS